MYFFLFKNKKSYIIILEKKNVKTKELLQRNILIEYLVTREHHKFVPFREDNDRYLSLFNSQKYSRR